MICREEKVARLETTIICEDLKIIWFYLNDTWTLVNHYLFFKLRNLEISLLEKKKHAMKVKKKENPILLDLLFIRIIRIFSSQFGNITHGQKKEKFKKFTYRSQWEIWAPFLSSKIFFLKCGFPNPIRIDGCLCVRFASRFESGHIYSAKTKPDLDVWFLKKWI